MLSFKEQFAKASDKQKRYYLSMINHFDISKLTEHDKLFFLWLASQNQMSPEKIISLFKKVNEEEKSFILWAMSQDKEKREQVLSMLSMTIVEP
ncbi:MAG: hypothetical protein H6Q66_2007 [Firmicutes bacterium]|nr:hypothetical protein [Bacillota bacterium]